MTPRPALGASASAWRIVEELESIAVVGHQDALTLLLVSKRASERTVRGFVSV